MKDQPPLLSYSSASSLQCCSVGFYSGDTDRLRNYIEIARRGRVDAVIAAGGGAGSKGYPCARESPLQGARGFVDEAGSTSCCRERRGGRSCVCDASRRRRIGWGVGNSDVDPFSVKATGKRGWRCSAGRCAAERAPGEHRGNQAAAGTGGDQRGQFGQVAKRDDRRTTDAVGAAAGSDGNAVAIKSNVLGGHCGCSGRFARAARRADRGAQPVRDGHSAADDQVPAPATVLRKGRRRSAAASAPPAEDGSRCRDLVVRGAVTVADRLRAAELGWQRVPAHGFSAGTVMSSPSTVKLEREIYAHHLLHSPHTRERLAEIFSALMLSAGGDTDRLRNYIEIARRGRVDAGVAAGGGGGSKGYPGGPEDKEERRPWKVKLRRAPGLATTGGFGRVHQAAPVAGPVARGHHEVGDRRSWA
eukprot:g11908.t1